MILRKRLEKRKIRKEKELSRSKTLNAVQLRQLNGSNATQKTVIPRSVKLDTGNDLAQQ